MINNDVNVWQMIFTGVAALAAIIAAGLAYRIGKRQIEISNFVELFLMPQQIIFKKVDSVDSEETQIAWKILVKNVSSYPVYLSSYTFNGIKEDIGSTPIPHNPDNWYGVPITKEVQDIGKLSLIIEFEDYLGKKYRSECFGKYEGASWNIHQTKRVEIRY